MKIPSQKTVETLVRNNPGWGYRSIMIKNDLQTVDKLLESNSTKGVDSFDILAGKQTALRKLLDIPFSDIDINVDKKIIKQNTDKEIMKLNKHPKKDDPGWKNWITAQLDVYKKFGADFK